MLISLASARARHMKAMKAMQEGLTVVRSEVKKITGCTRVSARTCRVTAHRQRLGEILEAVQATQNGPGREDVRHRSGYMSLRLVRMQ